MKKPANKSKFVATHIKKETPDVVTIFLSSSGQKLTYKAGQYMAVHLDKNKDSHGKFYSISSSPSEKELALTVKKIGQFSSALHKLKIGDVVYLSGPYGWFYPETKTEHVVFLAAGIGITPFFSILKDYVEHNIKQKMDIYYSNKTFQDITFHDEINKLAKVGLCQIHYHLTRDRLRYKLINDYERISISDIKKGLGHLKEKNFYICGSISFVSDLRKQLLSAKVSEDRIFTESFF